MMIEHITLLPKLIYGNGKVSKTFGELISMLMQSIQNLGVQNLSVRSVVNFEGYLLRMP